ncbi:AP2 domain-containing protein [Variovorax sp. 54]|uniref:AP2 domain-containing protein n=1 Tax=Variovorax sp. 54 TaxID=2035212 RepID=UPI0011802B4C|nr:AP2 domain-containing protein [Variovorax sp. 54]
MYGIIERHWGYEVSIMRKGTRYTKRFSVSRNGGMVPALRQALEWRDTIVQTIPPLERKERAQKLRSNNTTGVPGVSCRLSPDGKPREWIAKTYVSKGKVLRVGFSVRRWGSAALFLAIEERSKQLDRMNGLTDVHPAEAAIRQSSASKPGGAAAKSHSTDETATKRNRLPARRGKE